MRGAFPGAVLFVFVACSGAGNSSLYGPHAGDGGGSSSSGSSGSSTSSSSSGGSTGSSSGGTSSGSSGGLDAMAPGDDESDATSPPPEDASGPACMPSPMSASGACNSIPPPASTITVTCNATAPLPAGVGGVVHDGTYRMISAEYYGDGMACPQPETDGVTWDVCGSSWQISQNDSINGTPEPALIANATVVAAGTNITITLTCGLTDTQPIIYGYDADAQTLRIHTSTAGAPNVGRIDTFARQ